MRRELHVRFCEGGGVRFPSATRLIYSLALRPAEIVGLNVGDVFAPDGTPRSRVRVRAEIAKDGRAGFGGRPCSFIRDRMGHHATLAEA